MRPSLAANQTAHVADSQRSTTGPAVLRALAQTANSGCLQFHRLGSRARTRKAAEEQALFLNLGAALAEGGFAMPHPKDIDRSHSRAIMKVIGQQLRASLKLEPEQPESFRGQIERLRELEERSPAIVPADEDGQQRG
ncbi:hypothetical protein XH86_30910 [Bradyrhizobium guangdongense]|uniref:DUF1844 domain-containing protein n=2 Tax=Bradyrhizobium guangdongense TaxID=1325090 RepID=A0ABX6UMP6_9BRAD|nr:hypothetical protein [Bradyrhizobium sp. CCBAU 51627]QAU41601.1 hypothetical protein X265_30870 [Bradyrhizobium guangdongense]QOZ62663.1 hypothetical protein XH86_30910 [Bradyrhizobium guangdongense]